MELIIEANREVVSQGQDWPGHSADYLADCAVQFTEEELAPLGVETRQEKRFSAFNGGYLYNCHGSYDYWTEGPVHVYVAGKCSDHPQAAAIATALSRAQGRLDAELVRELSM